MPLDRRRFLSRVVTGGVAAHLPHTLTSAERAASSGGGHGAAAATTISAESLAAAEAIAGLQFTPQQRAPLVQTVADRAATWSALRAAPLSNDVFPVVGFDPHLAGISIPAARVPAPETAAPAIDPFTRPARAEDLAFCSVAQLGALLRSRQVTSRELTELCLARLRQFDPVLKAVITLTEARAFQLADAADAEIGAGRWRGPLHGIPWGAKDLFAVRGYPTTWGAAPFKDRSFDHDAEVVRRLDAAGAVLVAKLSLGALANGDQWFGGQTKCPWNIANGSSGSSAGSCAAVSAGLIPFALGSETLGSIVSPCTRNAVTGLRPTYGRVSRSGAMSLAWSMDKVGPIARCAEDCALVFSVLHGADAKDPTSRDAPFAWTPQRNLQGVRIGVLTAQFAQENEWADTNRAALETLRRLGAELVPFELPAAPTNALRLILNVEAAAAFDEFTRSGDIDELIAPRPSNWADTMRAARYIPAVEYIQANRLRARLIRELEQRLTEQNLDSWVSLPLGNHVVFTNLTGHPTVCVPTGFQPVKGQAADSPRRSTAGMAFNAALYRDDRALVAAHAFQQATDWHQRRPPAA